MQALCGVTLIASHEFASKVKFNVYDTLCYSPLLPMWQILTSNKLCAWRRNMPPPPASFTMISCKYENRQRLQFTTEFAKTNTNNIKNKYCAILPSLCRHCQSKAKHSRIWAQAMPFLPVKQVDL